MLFVTLLTVALLLAGGAMAQDKLVKRTGEEMKVKVLSVTKTKVKFVRQGTEAPVYTLPVSDIEYIDRGYENLDKNLSLCGAKIARIRD